MAVSSDTRIPLIQHLSSGAADISPDLLVAELLPERGEILLFGDYNTALAADLAIDHPEMPKNAFIPYAHHLTSPLEKTSAVNIKEKSGKVLHIADWEVLGKEIRDAGIKSLTCFRMVKADKSVLKDPDYLRALDATGSLGPTSHCVLQ